MTGVQDKVYVIIPALNEEQSIRKVLAEIPMDVVSEVVVCDNGSTDKTARNAEMSGATVVHQPQRGYGNACLAGMQYLREKPATQQPDIVVFIDADLSDYPDQLPELIHPILDADYDMVIGSRPLGNPEPGALQPQQRFGNWLATKLIRLIYGYSFTDLGPFRAIKWEALEALEMQDRTFGWTVEMQVKAAKQNLRCTEIPARYRKRIGQSKVSGTLRGSVMAGYKILWTIFKLA